jgi:hypothetical protein
MKAALDAWGASSNLFHQGFAKEADDEEVVAATMEKPGVVLQRPVGSNKPFSEHSGLPAAESLDRTLGISGKILARRLGEEVNGGYPGTQKHMKLAEKARLDRWSDRTGIDSKRRPIRKN